MDPHAVLQRPAPPLYHSFIHNTRGSAAMREIYRWSDRMADAPWTRHRKRQYESSGVVDTRGQRRTRAAWERERKRHQRRSEENLRYRQQIHEDICRSKRKIAVLRARLGLEPVFESIFVDMNPVVLPIPVANVELGQVQTGQGSGVYEIP